MSFTQYTFVAFFATVFCIQFQVVCNTIGGYVIDPVCLTAKSKNDWLISLKHVVMIEPTSGKNQLKFGGDPVWVPHNLFYILSIAK